MLASGPRGPSHSRYLDPNPKVVHLPPRDRIPHKGRGTCVCPSGCLTERKPDPHIKTWPLVPNKVPRLDKEKRFQETGDVAQQWSWHLCVTSITHPPKKFLKKGKGSRPLNSCVREPRLHRKRVLILLWTRWESSAPLILPNLS